MWFLLLLDGMFSVNLRYADGFLMIISVHFLYKLEQCSQWGFNRSGRGGGEQIHTYKEYVIPNNRPLTSFPWSVSLSSVSQGPSHLSESPGLLNLIFYRVIIRYCGFFSKILKYSGLLPFSVFLSVSVCVHTPALQQNQQSSEKSQISSKKHNI